MLGSLKVHLEDGFRMLLPLVHLEVDNKYIYFTPRYPESERLKGLIAWPDLLPSACIESRHRERNQKDDWPNFLCSNRCFQMAVENPFAEDAGLRKRTLPGLEKENATTTPPSHRNKITLTDKVPKEAPLPPSKCVSCLIMSWRAQDRHAIRPTDFASTFFWWKFHCSRKRIMLCARNTSDSRIEQFRINRAIRIVRFQGRFKH